MYISVYLDRLISLNEQHYTFSISLYFFLSWVDPRCERGAAEVFSFIPFFLSLFLSLSRAFPREERSAFILFFFSFSLSRAQPEKTRDGKNRQGPCRRRQRHRRRRRPQPRQQLQALLLRAVHEHAGHPVLRQHVASHDHISQHRGAAAGQDAAVQHRSHAGRGGNVESRCVFGCRGRDDGNIFFRPFFRCRSAFFSPLSFFHPPASFKRQHIMQRSARIFTLRWTSELFRSTGR